MPAISQFSSDYISPGSTGSEFVAEIDSSGASWTSQPNETSMMATSTGGGAARAVDAAAPAANDNNRSNSAPGDDISLGQRMISASAGNILTGLLGKLTQQGPHNAVTTNQIVS